MIGWINFVILLLSTVLTLVFYVRSVGPATLERKVGSVAYARCTRYRAIAAVFMTLASVDYIVYAFYPIPLPLPVRFSWPYWVSALVAVLIAIPAGILFVRGMIDAGEETMVVRQEHTLYGGIYRKIRHPQAAGEVWFWWVFAFLCHSPFLVIYSIVWLPIFHAMSRAEERDLLIRYGDDYRAYLETTGMYFPRRPASAGG